MIGDPTQFIRVVSDDDASVLEIAIVVWHGPHEPTLVWNSFRRWSSPPSDTELRTAEFDAMHDRRYFKTCEMCGELNNVGHMHDDVTCQSCAERHLGIAY